MASAGGQRSTVQLQAVATQPSSPARGSPRVAPDVANKVVHFKREELYKTSMHITTETVRVSEWKDCQRVVKAMDIDNVKDIQLRETFGVCLLCCGRGDIRIYGQDEDQRDEYFTCRNVENAGTVFLKLAELVHKLNDLKFGMARPDDKSIPKIIYSSKHDHCCVKCSRVMLCGCFLPTTVITKTAITQSRWQGPTRVTTRFDIDNVKDISLRQTCCNVLYGTGTIRVHGQDADQKEDFFDIPWVEHVSRVFTQFDRYVNLLNNRNRVGFE